MREWTPWHKNAMHTAGRWWAHGRARSSHAHSPSVARRSPRRAEPPPGQQLPAVEGRRRAASRPIGERHGGQCPIPPCMVTGQDGQTCETGGGLWSEAIVGGRRATGEPHLHTESARASRERTRACPGGACPIPHGRASRGSVRRSRHATSAASEGRREASLLCFALSHRTG